MDDESSVSAVVGLMVVETISVILYCSDVLNVVDGVVKNGVPVDKGGGEKVENGFGINESTTPIGPSKSISDSGHVNSSA